MPKPPARRDAARLRSPTCAQAARCGHGADSRVASCRPTLELMDRRLARRRRGATSASALAPDGHRRAAARRSRRRGRSGRAKRPSACERRAARPARSKCSARATTPSARRSGASAARLSLALRDDRAAQVQPRRRRAAGPRARAVRARRAAARRDYRLRIPCFGHAGDGNIHVNIMVDPGDADEMARAQAAERELFEGVVALEGSISGEHGIGFAKAPYLRPRAVGRRDRADAARQGRRSTRTAF